MQKMKCSVKGRLCSVDPAATPVTVRIILMDGVEVHGEASQELSASLRKDLGAYIHAHGEGKWSQVAGGAWSLQWLTVSSYEIIQNMDAKTAFNQLREIGGVSSAPNLHTDILKNRD